jgi:predicted pyridoxine 5'-phosphate oxidase superfamily flavin-nucleotide-binding protein
MDRLSEPAAEPLDAADATFHAGEAALQRQAGVRERLAQIGSRVIRDHMPEEHRELFEKLPTLIVGSLDARGRPWASVLSGWPGFIETPDERTMQVGALPRAGDPLQAALQPGAPLGLLGIEPQTRRRNRMNGRATRVGAGGFEVRVDQSFGNCPQYIQARAPHWVERAPAAEATRAEGAHLSTEALAWITRADTLFIATAAPPALRERRFGGVDVSHRGGRPGFVAVSEEEGASVLMLPEYRGNFFFNTLGNIDAYPFAGLLLIDYETGDTLQLSGAAQIVEHGAQRYVKLRVEAGVWARGVLPFVWSEPVFAPQLAPPPA